MADLYGGVMPISLPSHDIYRRLELGYTVSGCMHCLAACHLLAAATSATAHLDLKQ